MAAWRTTLVGAMAVLVSAAFSDASLAGDAANAANPQAQPNPLIEAVTPDKAQSGASMEEKARSVPCGTSARGCNPTAQPAADGNGAASGGGDGGVPDGRPPRRNFGELLQNLPGDEVCREMGGDGLLRQGHWDAAKFKCVYDDSRPEGGRQVPHAKFN